MSDVSLATRKHRRYAVFVVGMIVLFFVMPLVLPSHYNTFFVIYNLILTAHIIIKILLLFMGFYLNAKRNISAFTPCHLDIPNEDLPMYTILLPVYKEKLETLTSLLEAIGKFDYDPAKLDIKLIVEEKDTGTLEVAMRLKNDFIFDLVLVPDGKYKTKPRACNYALRTAVGEYLTIYDAEDRPEKYQLKKSLAAFKKYGENYACVQAALNYYNRNDNFITKSFCVEYAMWFDYTIISLDRLRMFFPLGGTSNHFRMERLKNIGGWDEYNVTEDAEIAVRLVRQGYEIGVINSITEEEAPNIIKSFLKQRTRWIKGFIQTFCDHMAVPGLFRQMGPKQMFVYWNFLFFSFFGYISIVMLVVQGNILWLMDIPFSQLSLWVMSINSALVLITATIAYFYIGGRRGIAKKILYFVPFLLYWTLHNIAGLMACWEICLKPFQWNKTEHGLFRMYESLKTKIKARP